MDVIEIRGLSVRTLIGVHERERHKPQDLLISLRLFADTRPAGESDRLEDALDYDAVARRVVAFAESAAYLLIERLAEGVAQVCLREFRVPRVEVRVEKPGALPRAKSVSVTIERS
jgi:FolB domain-containing protein